MEVDVTFTPTNGEASATIEIISSDLDEPLVEVTFTGSGPTQSEEPVEVIEDIIDFLYTSVSNETLIGSGPGRSAKGRLKALTNMLFNAEALIEEGNIYAAMGQLQSAYKKTANETFVTGPAAQELARQIAELIVIIREL